MAPRGLIGTLLATVLFAGCAGSGMRTPESANLAGNWFLVSVETPDGPKPAPAGAYLSIEGSSVTVPPGCNDMVGTREAVQANVGTLSVVGTKRFCDGDDSVSQEIFRGTWRYVATDSTLTLVAPDESVRLALRR